MTYIDFRELKNSISIEEAMIHLSLKDMKSEEGSYRGVCPMCKAGGHRTLVITPDKASYYCFTAKRGGDVISLAAHILGCGMKEAASFLQDKIARKGTVPQKNDERTKDDFQPLAHLHFDHEKVREFGLDAPTADALGIGFAAKGLMRGLIAVPVRNADGELCGYLGIPPDADVKFPTTWHHVASNVVPLKRKRA